MSWKISFGWTLFDAVLEDFRKLEQTNVVSSDNGYPLLPPHPWSPPRPPPWCLPHRPGCHPRRGVRPRPQVRSARNPEAVKCFKTDL